MEPETDLTAVGRDHDGLSSLLDDASRICTATATDAACGGCPADKSAQCRARLRNAVERLMDLMLDHFNREDALMRSLPQSGPIRLHCVRHGEDHIAVSQRYNRIVAGLDTMDVAAGSRAFDALVAAWLHEHAQRYDVELAALLSAFQTGRSG